MRPDNRPDESAASRYVAEIRRALPYEDRRSRRLCAEIETHLEDLFDAERRPPEDEALALARARFGAPALVAREWAAASLPAVARDLGALLGLGLLVIFATMRLRGFLLPAADGTAFRAALWIDRAAFAAALGFALAGLGAGLFGRRPPQAQWFACGAVFLAISVAGGLYASLSVAPTGVWTGLAVFAGVEAAITLLLARRILRFARLRRAATMAEAEGNVSSRR